MNQNELASWAMNMALAHRDDADEKKLHFVVLVGSPETGYTAAAGNIAPPNFERLIEAVHRASTEGRVNGITIPPSDGRPS